MMGSSSFTVSFSGQDIYARQLAAGEELLQTDPEDHEALARLHACLVAAYLFSDAPTAAEHAQKSIEAATLTADKNAKAWALVARCLTSIEPGAAEDRRRWSKEALDLAATTGEHEYAPTAYFLYLGALAELGEVGALDLALSENGSVLPGLPWLKEGRHFLWFRCLRATMDGQLNQAEELSHTAFEVATAAADPDAQSVLFGQLAIIRWLQGRIAEMEPALLQARQKSPHEPIWAASLAWIWFNQGRRGAARGLIRSLPDFHELPQDRNWLATACILGSVASQLSELSLCRSIRNAIRQYEDNLVTIGLGVTCWGTVSRPLALIELALGNIDQARTHYEKAVGRAAELGAQAWLAEAQMELGQLLKDHYPEEGDVRPADLVEEAQATVVALSLDGITLTTDASANSSLRAEPPPLSPTSGESTPLIEAFGMFSITDTTGRVATWQSRKARTLLQILVARRGAATSRESLMHMLWPDADPRVLANRFSVALSTARKALDPDAQLGRDGIIETSGSLVRLRLENVRVDVEHSLQQARAALALAVDDPGRHEQLEAAAAAVGSSVFGEDGEEPWFQDFSRVVSAAHFEVLHAFAQSSSERNDHLAALDAYERLLAVDAYDERAHVGLISSLERLGAPGRAVAARETYRLRMAEISV